MAKKIPWYVVIDWKSILGIIAVLIIICSIVLVSHFPEYMRSRKLDRYFGQSYGGIISVSENDKIKQSRLGSVFYVDSYTVHYFFEIDGKTYISSNLINANSKNTEFLKKFGYADSKVSIRYDTSNPHHSLIVLE
jgi:hypothetical protein